MNNWTDGYVDDLDYTFGFYRELAPSLLSFAALANNRRLAAELENISYCELGCGQGFSTNLLAAANPDIDFYANDFLPTHIVNAQRLAKEGKLNNVHFYDMSFEQFLEEPSLPKSFDVIALHGVYSWISPAARKQILRFIREKLKPGGIVYVSYNVLPGWASSMPLQRLFREHTSRDCRPHSLSIGDAIKAAKDLEMLGAAYFRQNPSASSILAKVASMPSAYFAHEFLNRDWNPFYFSDFVDEMTEAKLSYVGSLDFLASDDHLAFTPEQLDYMSRVLHPVDREQLRDFFTNQRFRTDLFAKGQSSYTFKASAGAWLETRFVAMKIACQASGTVKGIRKNIELNPAVFEQVIAGLSDKPMTVRELLGTLTVATNWSDLIHTLKLLVGSGEIAPCLTFEREETRMTSCRSFNVAVCNAAGDSENLQFLASPVTGSGIELNRIEQLFVKAIFEGREGTNDLSEFVWKILGPQGFRLSRDNEVLDTPEQNLIELRQRAELFVRNKLDILRLHRII